MCACVGAQLRRNSICLFVAKPQIEKKSRPKVQTSSIEPTQLDSPQILKHKMIEEKMRQLQTREDILRQLEQKMEENLAKVSQRVELNVGGRRYTTTKDTLLSIEDTYFTALLGSDRWQPDADGSYFIDRDEELFHYILQLLRTGTISIKHLNNEQKEDLKRELEYYLIPLPEGLQPDRSDILSREHAELIEEWLGGEKKIGQRLYKATVDSSRAASFHILCDNQGPTVTIIESQNGDLFGGYTDGSWTSANVYATTFGTFLFTLKNPHGITARLNLRPQSRERSVCCNGAHGPTWGAGYDLHVADMSDCNMSSYSYLPNSFEDPTGKGHALFTGNSHFKTKEVEVYQPVRRPDRSDILNAEHAWQIEEWLGEGKKIGQRLYKATQDGFESKSFHSYCDGKGPTVVVVRTHNDSLFGGYADASWSSDAEKELPLRSKESSRYNNGPTQSLPTYEDPTGKGDSLSTGAKHFVTREIETHTTSPRLSIRGAGETTTYSSQYQQRHLYQHNLDIMSPEGISTSDVSSMEIHRGRRQLETFREPESPRSSSPQRLTDGEWIISLCVVSFDIQRGQFIDETFPSITFDAEDAKAIAFSSFPDVNIGHGSTEFVYNFNLRLVSGTECFAACFFRQIPDSSQERGSIQKSVVLLSRQPQPSLLTQMICTIAPLYFTYGTPALEQAMANIEAWPDVKAGKTYQLALAGDIIDADVPEDPGVGREDQIFAPAACTNMNRFPPQLVFRSQLHTLHSILPHLWHLWEMILLQHPLLIFSGSPSESSDAVLSLVDMMTPLRHQGDCRPFVTVNDRNYPKYFGTKQPDGAILGITNPNLLQSWSGTKVMLAAERKNRGNFKCGVRYFQEISENNRGKVVTNIKPLLKIDNRSFLNEISTETNPHKMNDIIVEHFRGLTAMMLAPLDRYMTSLMPQRKMSILQDPPNLSEFSEDHFVESMGGRQTFRGNKSDELHFYRKFIRTENFSTWFRMRRGQARAKLYENYYLEVISSDIHQLMRERSELLSVDIYVRMHNFKQRIVSRAQGQKETKEMDKIMDVIFHCLPEDLKESIQATPPSPTPGSLWLQKTRNVSTHEEGRRLRDLSLNS
ncbi:hypothetical protein PROFUN_02023 [Planoprotostelium fungivorum]|uniref:BTB domain-containing protein n=1 Tax=Planoprotostelium fungivorum TaxID=1890364 RepID=A0A2P6NB70_9EUKA|nr:hypothetical protein PROFUN_02023 [Planoprotostelium fungivorum]